MRSRTSKGFVFHFIMREISLVHVVAQFCLRDYKRKMKSVGSSRAPLIQIDVILEVNIKRNYVFRGRLKFVDPSACDAWSQLRARLR